MKTKNETPAAEEVVEAVAVEVPPPSGSTEDVDGVKFPFPFDPKGNVSRLHAKMLAVQMEIAPIIKDAINPHFKSKYATIVAVWKAILPAAAKYGLLVYSDTHNGTITTHVVDVESGDELTSEVPISGSTPHQWGGASTYYRRYNMKSLFNIAEDDDDDDGNAASGIVFKQQLKSYTPPTAPNPPAVEDPIF